ncbi:MAG: putative maturation protein [Alehxovirus faecivivens]|uniref:Maturation protein n=1 Tax=Leviviridae sp. TaxID=2027243 RepID=A0ABY3STV7_9VIRU|nr:MAG: putative maturation protein [Leviviridae sp.]
MASRSRTRTVPFPSGGQRQFTSFGHPFGWEAGSPSRPKSFEKCDDVWKDGKNDHPLSIYREQWNVLPLNGINAVGPNQWEFQNYYDENVYLPSFISLPTWPSRTEDATKLLARTNPNRYGVQSLENLVDAKDLPKLLKLAGDTILKRGAGAYLTWEFGWKPLISDLKKVLDFQGQVDKKVNELHRLYQSGGLHRKMNLQRYTDTKDDSQTIFSSFGTTLTVRRQAIVEAERWGSVRYLPTSLPPKNERAYRQLAVRLVYGLDLSPSSVWEALPWTWLADWFGNVGDYLVRFNNLVPLVASTPCIMERYTQTTIHTRSDNVTNITGGSSIALLEGLNRYLVAPGITASIPFLTDRQLSILGALFITKHRAR